VDRQTDPLARAGLLGLPSLSSTVPPPGPSALFQPLLSSCRPGSPSRWGGWWPPHARDRGWRPRVSRLPVTKAHCPPLLCGGGGMGAPLHNGGLYPGGGARQTPVSPPTLGRRGGAACLDPGIRALKSLLPPTELSLSLPRCPQPCCRVPLSPSPRPPMALSLLHLSDDSVSPPPGVPRRHLPVPALSP